MTAAGGCRFVAATARCVGIVSKDSVPQRLQAGGVGRERLPVQESCAMGWQDPLGCLRRPRRQQAVEYGNSMDEPAGGRGAGVPPVAATAANGLIDDRGLSGAAARAHLAKVMGG